MAQEKKTLVATWIERCKNHPKVAVVVFLGIVIIGIGSVVDGFSKITNVFGKKAETVSRDSPYQPSAQTHGDNSPAINVGGTGNTVNVSYAVPPAVNRQYQETMQNKKKEIGFELIQKYTNGFVLLGAYNGVFVPFDEPDPVITADWKKSKVMVDALEHQLRVSLKDLSVKSKAPSVDMKVGVAEAVLPFKKGVPQPTRWLYLGNKSPIWFETIDDNLELPLFVIGFK